jgi:acetone carboxylase gamma subunit
MSQYTQKQVADLVDGKLEWNTVHRMLSMPKDAQRFALFLKVLQERVPWEDTIVLPLGPHLFIVQDKTTKQWVNKCTCGHVFGDYRQNWKLDALIYVRDSEERLTEVYPKLMAPDPTWQVFREYCCPSCGILHDVEAPTPWYPVVHDFEPDIEAFYRDWVGLPLPERAA